MARLGLWCFLVGALMKTSQTTVTEEKSRPVLVRPFAQQVQGMVCRSGLCGGAVGGQCNLHMRGVNVATGVKQAKRDLLSSRPRR